MTAGLPTGGPPLVGRSRELAEVLGRLEGGARLVTITGPAGMGKTRLALEVARRWSEHDGAAAACLSDIEGVTGAGGIVDAVAAVLSLPEPEEGIGGGPDERVGRALAAPGDLLVVLDDFDHAVEHAPVLTRRLSTAPGARFLVTCRERLGLGSETVVDLGPLALPEEDAPAEDAAGAEAVQLLVELLRRAGGELDPTSDEAGHVARIVRRLDGIPLAIELAAARLRIMGARALWHRLQGRLDVLGGARRDAPARHDALDTAVAWTFDLLRPWERDALAQCTVFRGGFTVEAAEAVLDLGRHTSRSGG